VNKLKDFMYSLGNFSASILGQTVSTFAIYFYVDVMKVPTKMISIVMFCYGIWNAINDPLFGQISDTTRTRWGRRIPYIAGFTLPLCVAFALLWMPPYPAGAEKSLFIWYFVIMFLFDGLFTIVVLNWTALFPEMYPGLEDRARVSALRQVLGIIGLIFGVALPLIIAEKFGWRYMGILFGAMGMVTMFASLYGAKERPEFVGEKNLKIGEALKQTYINKSFMTYVIAAMLVQYTFVGLQAVIPFYTKYVLNATEFQKTLFLGALFVMAIPFAPLWAKIIAKLGTKKSMIYAAGYYAVCLLPFFVATNYIHAVIIAVFLSFGLAGLLVLLDIFIADVVDEDEVRTGVRREGMYFGVNGFMIRLGISMNAIVMGGVLDKFGYNPNLDVQPASALTGMKFLMTVVPISAMVLALLIFSHYPLDGEKLAEVRSKIAAVRKEQAGD
jgi:GPH family glycoside/pentoside/hexuronide:cation symporter